MQAKASTTATIIDCFNMVFHLTATRQFHQGACDPMRDKLKHIGHKRYKVL